MRFDEIDRFPEPGPYERNMIPISELDRKEGEDEDEPEEDFGSAVPCATGRQVRGVACPVRKRPGCKLGGGAACQSLITTFRKEG